MTDTNHHVLTGKVDITSNLLVGSSHLFVDTNNNRVGLVTTNPEAGLHVNSNAYVNTDLRVGSQIEINATAGRVKAGSFEGDGSLLQNTPPGADGAAATIAVGTTTTGAAGTSASVTNSGTNSTAVFDFTIPKGDQGIQGNQGIQGIQGQGIQGIQGEDGAAATIENVTVTTGSAGSDASVTNSGTTSAAVFDFVIPRGDQGTAGTNGTNYFELSGSNIYRTTGNVGIGTSSPDYPLDVQYNSDSGIRSKGTGSNHASVYIDAGSGYGYLRFQHSGTDKFWIQSTPTGDLAFRPNGSSHVFDINSSGYTRVSEGGSASYVQTDNGGSIWRNYGTGLGAGIHFTGGAVIPADHNGTNHHTNTIDLGHTSYKWRNLYVNGQVNAGNLLSNGPTQSMSYYITGANTNMYNAGGLAGMRYNTNTYSWHRWNGPHHFDLYSNSSFTAAGVPFYINYYSGAQTRCYNFQNYSDDRIKTNERYITNATQTLLKLKPQIYDKGPNLGSTCSGTRVESGLIAQDVYYDTPELRHLVGYHDDAEIPDEKPYVDDDPQKDPDYSMWGSKSAAVDYIGLIAYLIKSNQEIHEELQSEKNKVATMELLVASLVKRVGDLENLVI